MSVRTNRNRGLLLVGLIVVLIVSVRIATQTHTASSTPVAMTFMGWTNAPGSERRFAVMTISNQAAFPIRWHGDWVEIEGEPNHRARIANLQLPSTYGPVLKCGASFNLAVGEPVDEGQGGRWRLSMSFSRYTLKARWLDFAFQHRLRPSVKLGAFLLVDDQRILNPSNHTTIGSAWLTR